MVAELDIDRFFQRLNKLYKHFMKHNATVWNSSDCLVLNKAPLADDDGDYKKSSLLHTWLFGYEMPDTVIILTKETDGNGGQFVMLSTKKKLDFVRPASEAIPEKSLLQKFTFLVRNKEDNNAENITTMWNIVAAPDDKVKKLGVFLKERDSNLERPGIVGSWEKKISEKVAAATSGDGDAEENKSTIELVECSSGLSFAMSVKDEGELDLMKKSSVLSNKVMKHGYVKKMEKVIDSDKKVSHESLAQYVEDILDDPSKVDKIKGVPAEDVQSCYTAIIQSGGVYDLRVSAQSTSEQLSHDVIMVSIGARYKHYCSNIIRTFFVDPPKRVSELYEVLLELQDACLLAMKPSKQLKSVYKTAIAFLKTHKKGKYEFLIKHLPKHLGFCTGLDFRETTMLLSQKNLSTFKQGMVFCLSLGFNNLELSDTDRSASNDKSAVKKLKQFSLMVGDTVSITGDNVDVMTKLGKNLTDITYNVNDAEDGSEEDDDDDSLGAPEAPNGDEAFARKLQKERGGSRASSRLAKGAAAQVDAQEGSAQRERKQISLMTRRNEERLRELARSKRNRGDDSDKDRVDELETYRHTRNFPDTVQPNAVKVDMANQCVILPICGNPVPFHISTIKNIVMPDDETATLLRINFYTAGMAVGKDAPANMAKLVAKYAPYASFIRELTFRSLEGSNLTLAFRQISELRKRARQRELREQEEATLVEQEKLVRTKNERIPRLSDLTMRPVISNRKTQGNLESHSNGLRFNSPRDGNVDIMYSNIKYAIFQPCESEIMVLIHFHLKNPIMVGKKKHSDVQFFTEVVDASQAVDNSRRSMYDPDEMDDEQRERQLRKRLNNAFKEFCKKVDAVAKKNGYTLEFDIPYRDLGFTGNPNKEMVSIFPTLNCLVNLSETPFFVVDLDEVDHVHFERVTYMSKAFDIVLVCNDFSKQPWRIDMIPNEDKDPVQEWLTDMEITYTEGPMNLNWKQIMSTVKEDDRFYKDTEEDEATKKEAGWEFLRMFGNEDDDDLDDDEGDSEFSDEPAGNEPTDDESEVEDMDSEDDDESDFDADDDLEEQGMDWDEMAAEAAISDKKRIRQDDGAVDPHPPPRSKKRSGGGGNRRRR